MFYLTKDTFDIIPIFISFIYKIEVMFVTGSLKWSYIINEKGRVIDIVFVTEFREKLICNCVISRRSKPCM